MSEPTYRIELTHEPQYPSIPWSARIIRLSDGDHIRTENGQTREEAFDKAQHTVRAMQNPESPSVVFLTEDGDIHDHHDQAA